MAQLHHGRITQKVCVGSRRGWEKVPSHPDTFSHCLQRHRTLLSVHQIDCMWYHFLSLPRSLSHLEIKHDVPCPESWWQIASAAEWAHRTLTVGPAQRSVRYWELVRRMFSQECLSVENLSTTTLEPYGAANIMLFLQSSVREASGWATMTGRLSMDRVEVSDVKLPVCDRIPLTFLFPSCCRLSRRHSTT